VDIQLPGISGLETYKVLSEDEKTKSIPIIFVEEMRNFLNE